MQVVILYYIYIYINIYIYLFINYWFDYYRSYCIMSGWQLWIDEVLRGASSSSSCCCHWLEWSSFSTREDAPPSAIIIFIHVCPSSIFIYFLKSPLLSFLIVAQTKFWVSIYVFQFKVIKFCMVMMWKLKGSKSWS